MATTTPPISLLKEFQSLQEMVTSKKPFICHGTSNKGVQCGRRIRQTAKEKLSVVVFEVIESLVKRRVGIECLLYKASCLVLCSWNQRHQDEARSKCKTWMETIPFLTTPLLMDGCNTEQTTPSPNTPPLEVLVSELSLSDEKRVETEFAADVPNGDPISSAACQQSPSILHSANSGDLSDHEGYRTRNSPESPLLVVKTDHSSTSDECGPSGHRTPKKDPSSPKDDSGVSMTLDTVGERQATRLVAVKVESVSPLAEKTSRTQQRKANARTSRQAATPDQPKLPKESTVPSIPRTFKPYRDPLKTLQQYIKMPLREKSLKPGYIYAFEIEGLAFSKIGCGWLRKNKNSFEASYDGRAREHGYCGWGKATNLFRQDVPHAFRVEQIIHRHFELGRMTEIDMIKGSNGKSCSHEKHTEWFDIPHETIVTVARAWIRWMNTNPYVMRDGKFRLTPEWEYRVETIELGKRGDDHWLEWLRRYVPEPTPEIVAIVLETKCSNELIDPNEKKDSPITVVTTEIAADQCSDETVFSSNDNFPQTEFVYRLKQSSTWPTAR